MSNQYKQAGVNIEAGYEAVSRIKKHVERTKTPGVLGGLGGFGGLFELTKHMAGMEEPVTVSGTDSVGTKVMLAFAMDKHDTIGIDAVAMCVNDVITVGAKPLFFLDYIGCGKLDPAQAEAIVEGVCEGCVQSGSALIGGEMAEMPGVYKPGEYDLVGFSVGIIDKKNIITGENITAGDVLIGLASSGVHSNGFSLIRKIITDNGLKLDQVYPELTAPGDKQQTLGEILLTPTRIYANAVTNLVSTVEVKGMAHITGGGFIENIPRILPAGLGANIARGTWDIPKIFNFLQERGGIDETEMYNLYNMGVGMVAAVSKENASKALEILAAQGEKAMVIGQVVPGEGVVLEN
ncbi:MAG: phosphoribosylformylglycinamidine cyclo-ligase [Defluviitaleaceae bacterium]|nr:phosphoribosylformylglycinamidine cyclo-ligase [Defluviitaleaceae bacterium]